MSGFGSECIQGGSLVLEFAEYREVKRNLRMRLGLSNNLNRSKVCQRESSVQNGSNGTFNPGAYIVSIPGHSLFGKKGQGSSGVTYIDKITRSVQRTDFENGGSCP